MHCQTHGTSKNVVRRRPSKPIFLAALSLATASALAPLAVAADPSDKLIKALSYKPRQAAVGYEQVPADVAGDCAIEEKTRSDGKGFWVTGSSGQPLRWFADTNGDNRLDRWCYFNAGVEVYRESDTDFNGTADEYRWLSTEGLRWGVDQNEDGEIDNWKMISAEEVTAEVVRATASRDAAQFSRLLISDAEIASLGLGPEKAAALKQHVADAAEQFRDWSAGQNVITSQSKWTNFGADKPGIVPAGTDGSNKDVVVYENVVALLEDSGKAKQLLVGTMIQVGSSWRLVDLPRAVSEGAVVSDTSLFFPASFSSRGGNNPAAPEIAGGISKAMENLVEELQAIDSKLLSEGGNQGLLQAKRADVLEKLISASTSPDDRTTWIKQFADTVSVATQTGAYPEGAQRLSEFVGKLSSINANDDEIAYVVFRTITAKHNQAMQQTKDDKEYETLQKNYLDDMQKFVAKYPTSEDSAEAMIQIALAAEFSGESKTAEQWYVKAKAGFGQTPAGRKAAGALERLNLVGQPFKIASRTLDNRQFSSDAYRGSPIVYHCWASWCEGCKAEMRALKELKSKYAKTKLQVVGINFDSEPDLALGYLKQQSFPWVHLYDEGGLESDLAVRYGILTLPFNVVVDSTGKVVKTGVHWTELDGILEELTK